MVTIYNRHALSQKERFTNAVIVGIIVALVCGIGYGIISHGLRFEFSIVFIAIGYVIAMAIQKYGRGVQPRFRILAVVCTLFAFLLADTISALGIEILFHPELWFFAFRGILISLLNTNINSLLALLFRIGGLYYAYQAATIV